jgi:hypothetical protein
MSELSLVVYVHVSKVLLLCQGYVINSIISMCNTQTFFVIEPTQRGRRTSKCARFLDWCGGSNVCFL